MKYEKMIATLADTIVWIAKERYEELKKTQHGPQNFNATLYSVKCDVSAKVAESFSRSVMPDLIRHPEINWIPASESKIRYSPARSDQCQCGDDEYDPHPEPVYKDICLACGRPRRIKSLTDKASNG